MKTDLGKWNLFKFLRRTAADKPAGDASSNVPAPRYSDWPDVSWLLSAVPCGAMSDMFLLEPFAGLNGLDRWLGDDSSSCFEPQVDVVNDGAALKGAAELPGFDHREDEQPTGRRPRAGVARRVE